MLFLHDPLTTIHLQKDPYQIPLAFAHKGFLSFLLISSFSDEVKERLSLNGNPIVILVRGAFPLQKVHYLNKSWMNVVRSVLNTLFMGLRISQYISKLKPKLIISYNYPLLLFTLRIAIKLTRLPTSLLCKLDSPGYQRSSSFVKEIIRRLALLLTFTSSDFVLVESYHGFKSFYHIMFPLASKLLIVPNGISRDLFVKLSKLPMENRDKVVLCVARIERYKNLELLIEAFASIARRGYSEWKLRIIGPIVDTKYYEWLMMLCQRKKIQDKVTFLGSVKLEDLIREYGKASVFVLPSRIEGFGIARMEAALAGLPVVTTGTSGSEFFPKELVLKDMTPEELTSILERLLDDSKIRVEYGLLCRRIASNFSWDKIIEKILSKVRGCKVNPYEFK